MFGNPGAVAQQFQMAVVAVLLAQQVQPIAELQQALAICLALDVALCLRNSLFQPVYLYSRIDYIPSISHNGLVKLCLNALHRLLERPTWTLHTGLGADRARSRAGPTR
jgi:hypothetical protein